MIKFDFSGDKEFTDVVDSMISCSLPHNNYDGRYFSEVLDSITKYIHIDEMTCEYDLLMTVLNNMRKIIVLQEGYEPKLTRDALDKFLSSGIPDYVDVKYKEVIDWMSDLGEIVNLSIEKDLERTKSLLYQTTMDLYDTCYNIEYESNNYPTLVITLREAFKSNAIIEGQRIQRKILSNGMRIGRKIYKGLDDFIEYNLGFLQEIQFRLIDGENKDTLILDDLAKAKEIMDKNKQQSQVLCKYGLPELDDFTPMLRHRLVVLVAPENTGKTIYSADIASSLLVEGRTVVYMCGESPNNQILNKILPSYIKKKYGKFVSETECMGIEECSPEAERLIRIATTEIVTSGNLIFRDSFTYDNCGEELRDLYKSKKFDAVIIDHSAAMMKAPGSKLWGEKECIDEATIQLREFKKQFPVYVFITSHPSSDASKELVKLKRVESNSPTRSSGLLSKEADELLVMYTTDELSKQNKVGIQVKKRRMARVPRKHIYLKVDYISLTFKYNDEDQAVTDSLVSKESLISEIENGNADNSNEFDFDILED